MKSDEVDKRKLKSNELQNEVEVAAQSTLDLMRMMS
jgi:hypothetical protein